MQPGIAARATSTADTPATMMSTQNQPATRCTPRVHTVAGSGAGCPDTIIVNPGSLYPTVDVQLFLGHVHKRGISSGSCCCPSLCHHSGSPLAHSRSVKPRGLTQTSVAAGAHPRVEKQDTLTHPITHVTPLHALGPGGHDGVGGRRRHVETQQTDVSCMIPAPQ